MPINDMGVLNQGWGVCGFTSSLYALYSNSPAQQGQLAAAGRVPTRILAEIKTYLRILQAEGRADLLQEIEDFTRSFGGNFRHFTPTGYILRVNNAVIVDPDVGNADYGIALPPRVVVDYLRRICQLPNASLVPVGTGGNEVILGVCDAGVANNYGGLEHYLYSLGGTIYSWGGQFPNVAAAAASLNPPANWHVGHEIAIG